MENDEYYKNMEEDAFDVAVQYTNAKELIEAKEYYGKDGMVDMCKALTELIADGREEGREEGREGLLVNLVKKKLQKKMSIEEIAEALEQDVVVIENIISKIK